MEVTFSFVALLQHFIPVFTAPTFQTFVEIMSGWVLSSRHRYVTDIIFSGGNVDNGHWSRFHRFFSHAAWDLEILSLCLAKLVVQVLAPGATLLWAVDDTLCRKRGLTVYGTGMHHDPLISSRAKPLVSWGHDWVVLGLIVVHPFWAPSKVFALPITMRLYRNRQGLTKGKKKQTKTTKPKADPNHRTRPQLAIELISMVATWFPHDDILVTGDSAYGGKSVLSKLPAHVDLISHVHPKGALYAPPVPPTAKRKGAPRKKGERLPGMVQWASDAKRPWTKTAAWNGNPTLATSRTSNELSWSPSYPTPNRADGHAKPICVPSSTPCCI
jgi:SRSO17 transposase